jgi:hypothetical protein
VAIKDYHRATLNAGERRVKHPGYGHLPRDSSVIDACLRQLILRLPGLGSQSNPEGLREAQNPHSV